MSGLFFVCAVFTVVSIPFQLGIKDLRNGMESIPVFHSLNLKPVKDYEDAFGRHGLFYLPKAVTAKKEINVEDPLREYVVIGLIDGDQPEAIIRNTSNQQIYFVRVGEKFGAMKLIEVNPHSAVVEYQGQTTKMQLQERNVSG